MCGIVGYTGPREAGPILIEGLKRLEYRGYDSAGIALVDDAGDLFVEKRAGKLANLQTAIADRTPARRDRARPHPLGDPRPPERPERPSPPGLHRRDHGHPQRDHRELPRAARRARGARPHARRPRPTPRRSPTSIEEAYEGDLADAVRAALRRLEGAYAIVVMHRGESDRLVGARKDVPLVVGLGDGESFLASDVAAILAHTNRIVFLEEGDVADLRPWGVTITGVDGVARERAVTTIDWTPEAAEKGGYEHFMLKEIHEQPESLSQSITGRVDTDGRIVVEELAGLEDVLRTVDPDRARRLRDRLLRGAHRRGGAPGLDRVCRPGPTSAPSSATARRRSTSGRSSSR